MRWTVERTSVAAFEEGDCIGYKPGNPRGEDQPAGIITVSEPCDDQHTYKKPDDHSDWWHLAWVQDEQPGKTFHWRGPVDSRDTRWYIVDRFIIEELP